MLFSEWDTDDVAFWLEKNGLNTFTQGFRDQKIDGLCLMEGLSENELQLCQVRTVGEKRTLQRKISELVGHSKLKVPKLTKKNVKPLAPEQKEDLLRRKKQVHRKTVLKFPGNKIPIIRGNPEAKRKIEELVDDCRQLINPDLGYDEDELRRHLRAILDERRRMVKEGYNYEEKSSTDESKEKSSNDEISCNEEFNSDHEKSSADVSELLEEPAELPGGADSVPLSTAETIILVYFGKGYTKEVKKDKHLIPLCREFQLKNIKSKEKNDLIMLLAKQLLTRKKVTLEKNADFYCLHRDSVIVQ